MQDDLKEMQDELYGKQATDSQAHSANYAYNIGSMDRPGLSRSLAAGT